MTPEQLTEGRKICQVYLASVASYHETFAAYKAVAGPDHIDDPALWRGPQERASWADVALRQSSDRLLSFVAWIAGRTLEPGDAAALKIDGRLIVVVAPVDDSERGPHFGQLDAGQVIDLCEGD